MASSYSSAAAGAAALDAETVPINSSPLPSIPSPAVPAREMDQILGGGKRKSTTYKRLILLFDGTWQDATDGRKSDYPSNVTRLGRAISQYAFDEANNEVEQIVFYEKGVGTGMLDRIVGGVLGAGVSANVRSAYAFLANNYDEGDSIYIFGFSRGAFTARALADLVATIGLLTKRGMDMFPYVYKTYYNFREGNIQGGGGGADDDDDCLFAGAGARQVQEFVSHLGKQYVSLRAADAIRIVGVWDTVAFHHPDVIRKLRVLGKIGMGYAGERFEFPDIYVPERVQYAFQGLALDETRKAYSPLLWALPKVRPAYPEVPGFSSLAGRARPVLKQVWFSGEHSDIGGGRSNPRLSDISLGWMISECYNTKLLGFDFEYLTASSSAEFIASLLPALSDRTPDGRLTKEGETEEGTKREEAAVEVRRVHSLLDTTICADFPVTTTATTTTPSSPTDQDPAARGPLQSSSFPPATVKTKSRQKYDKSKYPGKNILLPQDAQPWGTILGDTAEPGHNVGAKFASRVERLMGSADRVPLSILNEDVWTNEFMHTSIESRLLTPGDAGRAGDWAGLPGPPGLYPSRVIRGDIREVSAADVLLPPDDAIQDDFNGWAIEVHGILDLKNASFLSATNAGTPTRHNSADSGSGSDADAEFPVDSALGTSAAPSRSSTPGLGSAAAAGPKRRMSKTVRHMLDRFRSGSTVSLGTASSTAATTAATSASRIRSRTKTTCATTVFIPIAQEGLVERIFKNNVRPADDPETMRLFTFMPKP